MEATSNDAALAGPWGPSMLDHLSDAVVIVGPAGGVTYSNPAARAAGQANPPPVARRIGDQSLRTGQPVEATEGGWWRRAAPMPDGGVTFLMRPHTPEIAWNEAQLQALVNLVPLALLIAEAPSGRVLHGNAALERLLGRAPLRAQTVRHYADAVWFDGAGRRLLAEDYPLARAVAGIATSGVLQEFERGNGDRVQVRVSAAPVRDAAGRVVFAILALTDLDPEHRAKLMLERTVSNRTAALQQSRARVRELFEHSPMDMLVLRVHADGTVLIEESNAAFCRTTGVVRQDLAGQMLEAVLAPSTAATIGADARIALGANGFECLHTLAFPIGERTVRTYYRLLPNEEPGLQRVLLTQIDLTESRRIESALRQSLRLEVVGQLTGGVAHDFNNLLTAIIGSLELLSRRMTGEREQRWLQIATDAAHRGATLTQQLLSYARKQFLAPSAVDIPKAIGGMMELIRGSVGARITLETAFAPGTWAAHADAAQLELALLNLVVNARRAMPEGGRLLLSTRNVAFEDPALPPELEPGAYVVLAIADTGVGMEPDILSRAMEPFFTTKSIGEGSGLGLSQAYGFARQLGGTVRLQSITGTGTTAEVFLPRATAGRAPPARLLLVDDDEAVRSVAAALLREEGWQVDEASDGAAALEGLQSERYDVLLADLEMPGMSGAELATRATAQQPALRMLFVTSAPDPALTARLPGRVVAKPYSAQSLVDAVRAELGGR